MGKTTKQFELLLAELSERVRQLEQRERVLGGPGRRAEQDRVANSLPSPPTTADDEPLDDIGTTNLSG
jgi:hypothetical protein